MSCYWIIALAAVAAASAQVPAVGIQPVAPAISSSTDRPTVTVKRLSAAGPPLLGYIAGPGPTELHAIVGKSATPLLGDLIPVSDDTSNLFLPARQFYALVEKSSGEPLGVWPLRGAAASAGKQTEIPIAGAMAHPSLVAFSPLGSVAVLYSQANGELQVVSNLPAQPSIGKHFSLSSVGTPARIAISDDASLLAVALADGQLIVSLNGANWSALPGTFTPQAWSFVPNTHGLVISDTAQNAVVLFPDLTDSSAGLRTLAQDIQADRLAVTKDGQQLMAANSASSKVWSIDLKTGSVTPREGVATVETLSSLRDGFTFLLATSPVVSVLRSVAPPELLPKSAALAQPVNTKN